MKTRIALSALFATFSALLAQAAEWSYTQSGDIQLPEITEASTVTISSGVAVTNTTALTGSGLLTVKGGGTLVLTTDAPNFTGGIYVGKATVTVKTGGALGTETVTIQGKTSAKGTSRVLFDGAAAMTVGNDFDVASSGESSAANASLMTSGSATVTLTGDITGGSSMVVLYATSGEVHVSGSVTAATVYCCGNADVYFENVVKAGTLYSHASAGSWQSHVHLLASGNEIGTLQSRKNATLDAEAVNAVGGAKLTFEAKGIDFHGFDQTAAYIATTTSGPVTGGGDDFATLTLTGGVAAVSSVATMTGKLNLVVNDAGNEGDFVQTQNGGKHTMSGSLTISRGTYAVTGSPTFNNLSALSVGAQGKLSVASGTAWPFPNAKTLDVSFVTGAQYEGEPIEIWAKSLTLDGVLQPAGYYTHEDYPAVPDGVVVSMVSKAVTLSTSGEIDFAGTEGAVDGYWRVTVPTGVMVTNTTALTAAVGSNAIEFTGGGTFVQQAASPSFDAEIRIGKMTLKVTQENALGSGSVTISGYAKEKVSSRLYFDTGDATIEFPNDILAKTGSSDSQTSLERAALVFAGSKDAKVTLSGSVTLPSEWYVFYCLNATTVEFSGAVTADKLSLFANARPDYDFSGAVTAAVLYAYSDTSGHNANLQIHSSKNAIGELKSRKNAGMDVYAANGVGGASIYLGLKTMNLHGTDQMVASVWSTSLGDSGALSAGEEAGEAAVLTLTGGVAVATSVAKLKDGLSLVIDDKSADGDFVQVFTNGTHTMSGVLTVKRGTLDLKGNATFKKVSGVNVEGGELVLETSAATFGTAAEVKKAEIDLGIATDASVSIADGLTVNVNRLRIGGKGQAAGDYTGEGGPAGTKVLPQLSGTGILHVGRSTDQGLILLFL